MNVTIWTAPISLIIFFLNVLLWSNGQEINETATEHSEATNELPIRHCQDIWDYLNKRHSGYFEIDPDGNGPLKPFRVYCSMGNYTDPYQVATVVHHDSEVSKSIRGAEAPGSHVRNVSYYGIPEDALTALIDGSRYCEQFIKWECKGAQFGFWYPPTADSWWVGRNWQRQLYWGGAATDSHACGCHPYCQPTERNATCNCDANDKLAWLSDEGLLLDKSRLPVLQLRFGDTGQTNEAGRHTLGPLKCRQLPHKDVDMGSNFTAPIRLTSPYFQERYPPPFHRYTWTVTINKGDIIELVFPTYDVVHYGSYTAVKGCENVVKMEATRDSDGSVIIIEAQRDFPPYYISDGSRTVVKLTLVTCNQLKNLEAQGIEIVFRRAECVGCEAAIGKKTGNTVCRTETHCATIASHRYPYPHQIYDSPGHFQQKWLLSVRKNKIIKLEFNDFDVPNLPGNKKCTTRMGVLKIFHGDSILPHKKIGEFCNLNRQGVIYSRGNEMLLVYTGNYYKVGNGRGFHAVFRAIPKKNVPITSKDLKNVAKGKPAKQSSVVEGYGAHLAVDGIASTCIATNSEREPWWRVDLQEQHLIYGIKIVNKDPKTNPSLMKDSEPWPNGQYGLPMPNTGCPTSDLEKWQTGVRYHDLEYPITTVPDDKMMHWTPGIQLKGGLKEDHRGVEQHFCIKVNDTTNGDLEWMPGQYCIFRYGPQCPIDFKSGFIKWSNRSAHHQGNYANGTLPYGEYDSNFTKIYFCCRSDGDVNDPIRLPTKMPFYLFQYGEDCQRVDGMNNQKHDFHFWEEDSHLSVSSNRFKPPHPKIDVYRFEKGFSLYYCYYDIINSLRGFRVVVDNHGLSSTWSQYYDNKYYGMPRSVDEKFGNSYTCIHYPVAEKEFLTLNKTCEQPILGQYVTIYIYKRFESLQICEVEVYGKEMCGQPLGMSSEEIKDSQLNATSSENEGDHYYINARLNHRFGWCAGNDDQLRQLQVDLGNPTIISGVAVQGLNQASKLVFVWNFTLEFSNDTQKWVYDEEPYGRQMIYQCTQCKSKKYKNDLPVSFNMLKHFVARYVRFGILQFEEAPCMRAELYGCRSRDACGYNLSIDHGEIHSPNYPFYYGQDLSCWWTITPPAGKNVKLDFILFELAKPEPAHRAGSCRDYLTINLGSGLDPIKSTNLKSFPKSLISNGSMTITLKSCFRSTISRDRGFFAKYIFADCPGCGVGDYLCTDKYPCSSQCGYIKSINHPLNYENNHRCRWFIEVPELHYVSVIFEDFDVIGSENCQEDFVDFYEDNGTPKGNLIGRYCNSNMPPPVLYSSSNSITVEFSSTAKTTARGFLLKYKSERYELPQQLKSLNFDDPTKCPDQWKYYKEHCYKLMVEQQAIQWADAESACVQHGGHLISILDELEMAFVHHLLVNVWKMSRKRIYIGLTDKQQDGTFRWQDGNPMSYADWSKAVFQDDYPQPDGGPYEGCTVIQLDSIHSTNNWYDVPCSLDSQNGVKIYMCKARSNASDLVNHSQVIIWKRRENNILEKIAPHRLFMCRSLEYISYLFVCDGEKDCRDESDEMHCEKQGSNFECKNGRRISISKYCDDVQDCKDGSDEQNCVHRECLKNEAKCKNGQCIPFSKWCDLKMDCKDASDEADCSGKCNRNTTFQCYDGKCIPKHAYCDGSFDCPGSYHEDEVKGCYIVPEQKRTFGKQPIYRQSCYELFLLDNITQSGYYKIDPDLDGPLLPFLVHCIVDSSAHSVRTEIHHDSEDRIYTHGEIDLQGSYRRDIIYYYGTWDQLKTLANISQSCRQHVKWECIGGSLPFENETPITWMSWDGTLHNYCCGASENLTCDCDPTCDDISNLQCSCNANKTEIAGYIHDKTQLPIRQVSFGRDYDTGHAGYHIIGPMECYGGEVNEYRIAKTCNHCDKILCNNGHYTNISYKCIYDLDEYGYIIGCRDVTHLRDCENFDCPINHLKCPASYCIPFRFRCNGVFDCPGGYDENDCENFTCPGYYRCHNTSYCIPLHQLCDGKKQCEHDDDEAFCDIECPLQCQCYGLHVNCTHRNLISLPPLLSPQTRKLDLGHNLLTFKETRGVRQTRQLAELLLNHNKITEITKELFHGLQNLYFLDLSYNNIIKIEALAFQGLFNLLKLNLQGNQILEVLEPHAFVGLRILPSLNISQTKLSILQKDTFLGLINLQNLNLTSNSIHRVEDGAFSSLTKVEVLDIRGNRIKEFSKLMFTELDRLQFLYSDSFSFCCLAYPDVAFKDCLPQADEFSSCKDLMSNSILRMFLWFLGILALIGNLVVICWRSKTKDVNKVSSLLILSLGCADFLMGVYLLIIASVDAYYRGHYIAYSDHWQESVLCKVAGFLSTISSEASVFTLTFITIDRLICIAFPLSIRRFTLQTTYGLISGSWTTAVLIAVMPFFVESYFKNEFYARSGVCLALHITNRKPAGWEYSVAIFFSVNFVAFLIIIVSYFYMYVTIKRSSRYVNRNQAKKSSETKIGRQMALIVLTNFCCWMPVIIMGICAMLGSAISGEIYAWTAVFILPLNSATNPIVYTLSSVQFKTMLLRKRMHNLQHSTSNSHVQSSLAIHRIKNGAYAWTYRPPKGYTSLQHFLRTRYPLNVTDVLDIARGLCQALDDLHSNGYALGGFEMDYIFVYKSESGMVNVYLPDINAYQTCGPLTEVHTEDTARDIEDFGKIVKKMLQIYHVTEKKAIYNRVSSC